ncbi:MAG: ABC transporter ATP-binding protein, partial [Firmicutes bacterium]|nr:ABC transporter ATP-binding protein [Bacillota bacterium]
MGVPSTVVEASGLTKWYSRVRALDGVNLEVKSGAILGVLGPNGSGKSTLLKIIGGLIRPSAGRITVVGSKPSSRTKALTAYMPESDHLYPWMTVEQTLRFVSSFYRDWDNARARELMGAMELPASAGVASLSKGGRARLRLLLCLARRAPLVLLDEPLSGIDITSRSRIIRAIVSEYRAGEQAIVLSTHQVAESESIFDDVLFLKEGRVALCGAAENLRADHGC